MNPVEGAPTRYVGKYTVGNLPATDKAVLRVDLTDARGRTYTATAASTISIATAGIRTPTFANLANGDRVRSPLTLSGVTSPEATVLIRIVYAFNLLKMLPQTGVLTNVETAADKTGQFKSDPIDLTIPMARRGITYTVTAVARDASGQESQMAKLELKSER